MLDSIPDGTHCFIDANIIYYHLVSVTPVSAQCRPFFKRVETGLLNASTSAAVVSEATHKVMLAEAIQRHGLAHQGLAHRLQRRRNLIATLSEHQKVGLLIRALGVRVEPMTLSD